MMNKGSGWWVTFILAYAFGMIMIMYLVVAYVNASANANIKLQNGLFQKQNDSLKQELSKMRLGTHTVK